PIEADRVAPRLQYAEYVNQGKFQVLHCGLDNAWGNFGFVSDGGIDGRLTMNNNDLIPSLLYPDGPFLGDVADTLANFYDGELQDEQE
ncbi:MAG: hypothetical protein AAFZ07_29695, partial [Actinomycetota bacterium]